MSGTFYRSPAPGEPAFVNMGDRVEKGQTIGIIEAMKLMNEIEVQPSTARSPYYYNVSGHDVARCRPKCREKLWDS